MGEEITNSLYLWDREKRLIFSYNNAKTHFLPFKSFIFSEILVSKEDADTWL